MKYLTPDELSKRWLGKITVATLKNWRRIGRGPDYTKIGSRVFYSVEAVCAWETDQIHQPGEKKK